MEPTFTSCFPAGKGVMMSLDFSGDISGSWVEQTAGNKLVYKENNGNLFVFTGNLTITTFLQARLKKLPFSNSFLHLVVNNFIQIQEEDTMDVCRSCKYTNI